MAGFRVEFFEGQTRGDVCRVVSAVFSTMIAYEQRRELLIKKEHYMNTGDDDVCKRGRPRTQPPRGESTCPFDLANKKVKSTPCNKTNKFGVESAAKCGIGARGSSPNEGTGNTPLSPETARPRHPTVHLLCVPPPMSKQGRTLCLFSRAKLSKSFKLQVFQFQVSVRFL